MNFFSKIHEPRVPDAVPAASGAAGAGAAPWGRRPRWRRRPPLAGRVGSRAPCNLRQPQKEKQKKNVKGHVLFLSKQKRVEKRRREVESERDESTCSRKESVLFRFRKRVPERNLFVLFQEMCSRKESFMLQLTKCSRKGSFLFLFMKHVPESDLFCSVWRNVFQKGIVFVSF